MKTLYAVPWYACNLNCSHCHVSKRQVPIDFGKFLSTLRAAEDYDHVVLFGGEPTLDWNKFVEILDTRKISSVSTNLTVHPTTFVKSEFLQTIKSYDVSIATSWNPDRFTPALYELWFDNLKCLTGLVDITVMITLTEDLLRIGVGTMVFVLGRLEGVGVKKFLFEPYIGDLEVHDKADEWLCELHDAYPGLMTNLLEERLSDWNCNCDETYTLEPDGVIRKGCPDLLASGLQNFCVDCLTCNNSDICRPCMLQKTCSYPKKLAKKLGVLK